MPLNYVSLVTGEDGLDRCGWVGKDAEYMRYHDEEWGVPVRDDQLLFEHLCLEGFQAGLSWITILKRRPGFRAAFADFDIATVAAMNESDTERLLLDTGIIRNRQKINATIDNARITLDLIAHSPVASGPTSAAGALTDLIWSHQPAPGRARWAIMNDVPDITPESEALSKTLRVLGYHFVGPTTMYALMQSAGLVDDHVVGCHRAL
jgi:DNA-3-methyladenine glycosylase I